MKDPRYMNSSIFSRRKEEWVMENIKNIIIELFKKIEILPNWKLVDTGWIDPGRGSKEELKRHLLKPLRIVLDNSKEEFEYIIQIPQLVGDQFFYIGGHLKVPMFQIFDFPVIYRKESGILKLRTNTISVGVDLDKGFRFSLFNKSIPIDLLISAVYTRDEYQNFIDTLEKKNEHLLSISQLCFEKWSTSSQKDRMKELGNYFSTTHADQIRKSKNIIFSLKLAYDVDIFNHKFFKTDSIIFEVLSAINGGSVSDTSLDFKRIRFMEYILSPLVKKIYDMIFAFKNSSKSKFQITQTILFDFCNKSEIIRYNFPVNPISEIASLLQISLTGPGGFKKDNVPLYLRNLDNSQFGRVCPADTPDRSGCGVTLNLVPTVDIKEDGSFGLPTEEVICSYPISLIPFLEHDDQVRLQMASSQMKQSILLIDPEKPMIRSGIESYYLDNGTFIYRAKEDGYVIHLEDTIMIVAYDKDKKDKEIDCFRIGLRNMNQGAVDNIIPKIRKESTRFKKGDILCESEFLKDAELNIGRNFLVGVAIWKGFNYEDGIVISRSVSENKFTSPHHVSLDFNIEPSQVLLSLEDDRYKPLPEIGDVLRKGEVYAKIKVIDYQNELRNINIEPLEMCSPIDCRVISIEIFPNHWNKQVSEYCGFVDKYIADQTDRFAIIDSKLHNLIPKEKVEKLETINGISNLNCRSKKGKYSLRGQKIKGIHFKIQAVYNECIGIGDKIANRHGNKGIIALIEDDDNMPRLPDGRKLDIIINPLGIISRMNIGQLFELHLGECLYQLKNHLTEILNDDKDKKADRLVHYLYGFLKIIDRTSDEHIINEFMNELCGLCYSIVDFDFRNNMPVILPEPNMNIDGIIKFIDDLHLIQPPFQSIGSHELDLAIKYTNARYKYKLSDPINNSYNIENDIACGYVYFTKLIHRSSDKMSARSIGPYSKKTLQPLGGKSRQGGHRVGEMEVWALLAHGAHHFLKVLLTVQADSPGLKNKLLASILDNPELAKSNCSDFRTQSLRLLDAYLLMLGLKIKHDDNLEEVNQEK